jgi:formylglycine-generating enzyme required for sulfatase activity
VPKATKEQLWKNITETIKYLDGVGEEFVKRVTLISVGQLFHGWKSDMNRKYVKKQLVPKHMGKITQAQWKEFVQQKTETEALAISGKFAEILKKNIYPHHLGSSGYVGKVGEWKKKLEETITTDKHNLLEGIEERTQHWILDRSNLIEDDTLVYKKKEVNEVQQKALQVAAK